ncbi:hypothetical protein PFISCL1PPCAC_8720 [Pristionchus fissidentatus]|uniref:Thiamin pyrophosphokinase thiamin-binding domain-containing protein n=1 Tax=Pristionchus fissidentatus TaxID=1538716 RepID=A0AAV5VGT6_9BILA|nr:hypothetical protein PFISCL1PPCAC_8720 [Pristionchus fissidentatus]
MSVIKPLEIFSKKAFQSSCIWLGGCAPATGERPCWRWMWNGADNRIANDNGAVAIEARVRSRILKGPSMISGDVAGLGELTKKYYKEKQCGIFPATDECRTDLCNCLDLIKGTKGSPPTFVLGGLSGRLDHSFATLNSLLLALSDNPRAPVYVMDGDNIVFVVPKGTHRISLDRALLTDVCGFAPLCQYETRVTTRGFRWNLDDAPLSFGGTISTSNELENDEISLKTSAPLILTFELLSSITGLDEPPK